MDSLGRGTPGGFLPREPRERSARDPAAPWILGSGAQAAIFVGVGLLAYLFWLPNVSRLRKENPKTTAYIDLYVRNASARGRRPVVMMRWVPLSDISPNLRNAVVIEEDDMFYRHHGVDWDAIREALRYDWRKGKMARGASTITQQVARNLYLSPSKNPLRKLKELLIARKLERTLTKKRILEIYLNIAEWGPGVYGAEAACQIYYGKHASEVSPEEAVALAAALPSPWRLNPARPEKPWMAKRKDVLLARMRRAGYLPPEVSETDVEFPEGVVESTGPSAAAPAVPAVPAGAPDNHSGGDR